MIDLIRETNRVYQQCIRAKGMGLPATLTLEEWLETIQQFNGLCAYCLERPFEGLDHLVPCTAQGGTTAENSIPACIHCNSKKGGRIIVDVQSELSLQEKLASVRFVLSHDVSIPLPADRCRQKDNDAQPLTIRFPADLLDELRELSHEDQRSLNNEIISLLNTVMPQKGIHI